MLYALTIIAAIIMGLMSLVTLATLWDKDAPKAMVFFFGLFLFTAVVLVYNTASVECEDVVLEESD